MEWHGDIDPIFHFHDSQRKGRSLPFGSEIQCDQPHKTTLRLQFQARSISEARTSRSLRVFQWLSVDKTPHPGKKDAVVCGIKILVQPRRKNRIFKKKNSHPTRFFIAQTPLGPRTSGSLTDGCGGFDWRGTFKRKNPSDPQPKTLKWRNSGKIMDPFFEICWKMGKKKSTPKNRSRFLHGWDTTLRAGPVMLLPPFNNGSDQEREMAYLKTLKGPPKGELKICWSWMCSCLP